MYVYILKHTLGLGKLKESENILWYTTVVLVVCDAIYFLSFQYYIEHTSCSTHHKHQKTMYVYTYSNTPWDLGNGKKVKIVLLIINQLR